MLHTDFFAKKINIRLNIGPIISNDAAGISENSFFPGKMSGISLRNIIGDQSAGFEIFPIYGRGISMVVHVWIVLM